MLFRALALTGVMTFGSIAPSLAAPAAVDRQEPIRLANGHDDRTITVSVNDGATIGVDRVEMKYSFYDGSFYEYDMQANEMPPSLNLAAIESGVLPALSRAGIPASSVTFSESPMGLYGGGEVGVIVSLPASHAAIANANAAMTDAAAQFPDLAMQTVGIRLGTAGCDALGTEARNNAIALATDRAMMLATGLGVTLGEVVAVRETYQDLVPYGAATCLEPSGAFPPVGLATYGGEWTMYSSGAPLEIEMTVSLEMVFSAE